MNLILFGLNIIKYNQRLSISQLYAEYRRLFKIGGLVTLNSIPDANFLNKKRLRFFIEKLSLQLIK